MNTYKVAANRPDYELLNQNNIEGFVVVVAMSQLIMLKMARKPVKLKKENPAVCAGEGKHSKGK